MSLVYYTTISVQLSEQSGAEDLFGSHLLNSCCMQTGQEAGSCIQLECIDTLVFVCVSRNKNIKKRLSRS